LRIFDYDVIVIGAGAAGMICASIAGQRGRRAVLIEHTPNVGGKIRISGGGRCNFTNIHCKPENFISRNRTSVAPRSPATRPAILSPWSTSTASLITKRSSVSCDASSQGIIDMLRTECDANGVGWQMPCEVLAIKKTPERFLLKTDKGELRSASLVIATGGLSVSKLGASPFGYKVAEQFGLGIVTPRPGLVPLAFDTQELARYDDLSGVSVDALVTCHSRHFREKLLFTHRGLSGPAILQISSYWTPGEPIHIDLLPERSAQALLFENRRSRALPATLLAETLPRRFAQQWCEAMGATQPVDQMSESKRFHRVRRGVRDDRCDDRRQRLCPARAVRGRDERPLFHEFSRRRK
jgi:predicted Rossmann fold flavoprotein